jgi:uncharacterized Zn finger protein (UPF0148 family)
MAIRSSRSSLPALRLPVHTFVGKHCPACGTHSARCQEDMDDGRTICHVTGQTLVTCEACQRPALDAVPQTIGGDTVHICHDCARGAGRPERT